jgi:hypothetical protein
MSCLEVPYKRPNMYGLSRGTLQKTYNVCVVILLLKGIDSCMYVLSKGTLQKTYNVCVVIFFDNTYILGLL